MATDGIPGGSLLLAKQRHSIADRHQAELNPVVVDHGRVEATDRLGDLIRDGGVGDLALTQCVIDRDHPTLPKQLQRILLVGDEISLVGVDEDEVETLPWCPSSMSALSD